MKTRTCILFTRLVALIVMLPLVQGAAAHGVDQYQGVRPTRDGTPAVTWSRTLSPGDDVEAPESATTVFSATSAPSVIQADAEHVEFVGQTGGTSTAVALKGSHVYLGEGPRLTVLDVAHPASPVLLGKTPQLLGFVQDVRIDGDYAYVAASGAGLYVVDISTPSDPAIVGFCSTPGEAYGIEIAAGHAYVADGAAGLLVVDISESAHPKVVGHVDTPGTARDVSTSGSHVYVADGYEGLRVIDVSDPTNPSSVGACQTPGWGLRVTIADGYAFVADGYHGLQVLDISVPSNPVAAGSIGTSASADVTVRGSYAYVAGDPLLPDANGLLWIVDVSDPASPTQKGHLRYAPGSGSAVVVDDDHAYVADSGGGMRVVDISSPSDPMEVGIYRIVGQAQDVAVHGSHAYLVDGYSLQATDVAVPHQPIRVGLRDTYGWARRVDLANGYAYVADGDALRVIDVADPAAPVEVSTCYPRMGAEDAVALGSYAYVATGPTGGGLQLVDISRPSDPIEVAFYETPGAAHSVAVVGSSVYVADGVSGLLVVDVSNPTSPKALGSSDIPGYARRVAVAGSYGFVADGNGDLWVLDVSDPAHPATLAFYATPGEGQDVAVDGHYVYVADGHRGLRVLDASDPTNLTEMGYYDTPGYASGVDVSGGYAYVADGSGGFSVLRYVNHSISGQVLDARGAPISGIAVATGTGASSLTDPDGAYTIVGLAPGTHSLAPVTPGFLWSPESRTVTIPPDVTNQDFTGRNIRKGSSTPTSCAVDYGDPLTYTVELAYPDDQTLVFYDPIPSYAAYISGSLSAPAGIGHDAAANAIRGPLTLSAGVPQTVTLAVRVEITGTMESGPLIVNSACVHPVDGGLPDCTWSNEVVNFTYVWPVYLPLTVREF